jgi:hypothetical protein
MLKRLLIAFLLAVPCFLPNKSNAQIPISPYFFGQHAWMPDSIGKRKYFGKLHKNRHHIEASSAQTVRFGGIGPDDNMPSKYQYNQMIDSIRKRGMKPNMQAPYPDKNWCGLLFKQVYFKQELTSGLMTFIVAEKNLKGQEFKLFTDKSRAVNEKVEM